MCSGSFAWKLIEINISLTYGSCNSGNIYSFFSLFRYDLVHPSAYWKLHSFFVGPCFAKLNDIQIVSCSLLFSVVDVSFFLNFSTGKISCILLGDNWYCIYLLWPQAVYNFCYEQKIASVIFFSPNEFLLLGEKNIREIRALRLVKLIPFSWFKKAVWRKERSVWKFSQPFFTFNGNMSFGPKTN